MSQAAGKRGDSKGEISMRKMTSGLYRGLAVVVVGVGCVASVSVNAQSFPSHPIKLVSPYPPGGSGDILDRVLAQALSESFSQQVIVENRAGGSGGNVGADMVAKSPPDGYTLLATASPPLVINASLYSNLAYDPEKDFMPITRIASVPIVLVVNPKTPANSVQELVALAKAKPGVLAFGSSGNGTTNHLSAELLKFTAGINILHVPYRGEAPAMNDLIAGQIPAMFQNLPSAISHIEGGTLRALAVTTLNRSAALPNVPTMRESGFPEFEASAWFGMVAPAGTPVATIDRLYAETAKALKRTDVRRRFAELGADAGGETPAEFGAFMTAERKKWGDIIKRSGARID
jgi:tripartite-type tricarboxylate transporter receptor subunit TctC